MLNNLGQISFKNAVKITKNKGWVVRVANFKSSFLNSLFQAPRETREGEGEGTKTTGVGERKRGKEEEPVIISLNTSCRPLFPKCVNMSKCQTFHCPGFDYSREFSSPYIASMSRTPKGSPGLRFQPSKSCRFCQKNLTCLGTKVPRVYLFNAVRNKELINATLSSEETLVLADVVPSLGCIFASF